jgi:glycosyltransferase involved in cell wall biosynthesis
LLLNQCFYPDVASTGQHLTDLAVGLAAQGHEVTVVASSRGYDNPDLRFPRRERWRGIDIIRIPTLGLGKKAKWRRAADFASFLACCVLRLLFVPRQDAVLAMTSPPLISFIGALYTKLRGGQFYFWVMDLNPDEAVAAGWLREDSLAARSLQSLLRYSLRRARRVFVLDRFMKGRVLAKGVAEENLVVVAPWSHDDATKYDVEGRKAFRAEHGLSGKFVVMYSGNHSPCHPLDTVLEAAGRLGRRGDIAFCFAGGGSEHKKVREFAAARGLGNIKCLPYQPLEKLSASLSAADMHVVVMGDPFKGIVHPCKVYNVLSIGVPILYVGPAESHITDVVSELKDGDYARVALHGETEKVTAHILAAAAEPSRNSDEARGLARRFARERLLPRMTAEITFAPGAPVASSAARAPEV